MAYLAAGFLLFMTVVQGFYSAIDQATTPPPPRKVQPVTRLAKNPEKPPQRYVAPAKVEFPIY